MAKQGSTSKYAFLKFLAESKKDQRNRLLENITRPQIRILSESAFNLFFNKDIEIEENKKNS